MKKYLYVASCTEDGGVYRYEMRDGTPILADKFSCDRPMYLAVRGDVMYILLRAPFADSAHSGVMTCRIEKDGGLSPLTAPVSTEGEVGCHIAVDGEDVYVANYVSGSVCRLGHTLITHEGKGPHPKRQTAPHAHGVLITPNGEHLLATDLGTDTVYVYDRALREVSRACVIAGDGCRHMVITRDGRRLFTVNELGNTVALFDMADGRLTYRASYSTLRPDGESVASIAAAIRLSADEKMLYVTNRGENTVARFSVTEEGLRYLDAVSTAGNEPRDFLILDEGRTAAVTNQFSDSLLFYAVDREGALSPTVRISLPAPLCLVEA